MTARPILAVFPLWLGAAFLAGHLGPALSGPGSDDPLYRLIGGAKEAVGDVFLLKADEYFHGGVKRKFDHGEGGAEREGIIDAARGKIGKHGLAEEPMDPPKDWIEAWNRQVHVEEHRHLVSDERKEILPFLALAVNLDPYNVEGVLATAYWLETGVDKPEEARAVLLKGARDNPTSWEIEYRLGRLEFEHFRDYAAAGARLESALEKTRGQDVLRGVLADILIHLGDSLVEIGEPERARAYFEKALSLYGPGEAPALVRALEEKISGAALSDPTAP